MRIVCKMVVGANCLFLLGCLATASAQTLNPTASDQQTEINPIVQSAARSPVGAYKTCVAELLKKLVLPPELRGPREQLPPGVAWPSKEADEAATALAEMHAPEVIPFLVHNLIAKRNYFYIHMGDSGYTYLDLLLAHFGKEGADGVIACCKQNYHRDDEWMKMAGHAVACAYGFDEEGKAIAVAIVDRECQQYKHSKELPRLRQAVESAAFLGR